MPTIIPHPFNNKFPIEFVGTDQVIPENKTREMYYEIAESMAGPLCYYHKNIENLVSILDKVTDKNVRIKYGDINIFLRRETVDKFNTALKLLLSQDYMSPSLLSYLHGVLSKILKFHLEIK